MTPGSNSNDHDLPKSLNAEVDEHAIPVHRRLLQLVMSRVKNIEKFERLAAGASNKPQVVDRSGRDEKSPRDSDPPKSQNFPFIAKLINGGFGGCAGMAVAFPFDLVKSRLQNQQIGPDGTRMYRGILDCGMKTFKNEGFLGMYRGLGITLALMFPERAIYLSSNDLFRHKLTLPDGSLALHRQILAGVGAGCVQLTLITPMELLKIQMQIAGRLNTERVSAIGLILSIVKDKGVMGMYRGITPTALRDISFSAIFFPLFHLCNELGPKRPDGTAVFWVSFLSGLVSGMTSALIVTPLDCVKTRLQTLTKESTAPEFNGVIDTFQKMVKYEGAQSLFKGGICRIIVNAPKFAVTQMVYFFGAGEWLMSFFHKN